MACVIALLACTLSIFHDSVWSLFSSSPSPLSDLFSSSSFSSSSFPFSSLFSSSSSPLSSLSFFNREKKIAQQLSKTQVHEKLLNHSREFNVPEIIPITEGVFVAIGYAIANSIVVECEQSLTVVDTTESIASAKKIRHDLFEAYPQLRHKPVKHVVYTHFHPDHVFGTKGWVDDEKNPPVVISHPGTLKELERMMSLTSTVTQFRAVRQFGNLLRKLQDEYGQKGEKSQATAPSGMHNEGDGDSHDHDEAQKSATDEDEGSTRRQLYQNNSRLFINGGVGPYLIYGDPRDRSMFYPTLTLNKSVETLNLDGVEFQFHHAQGETEDQIFIYLPRKRVLMPADNIYRAFPNIYAIRGSPPRSAREWMKSIDAMRRLSPPPKFMTPQHTRPVFGEEAISDILTNYRDGIAFVHDQTVRYINLGYYPDDIVTLVRQAMPQRLLSHPFLQEFYGTIDWGVRAVFDGYLGWFSGDPVDLYPLSKQRQAIRLIEMVKSIDLVLETAEENLLNHRDRDDCQWALQLSDAVLALPNKSPQSDKEKLLSESTMKEIYSLDKKKFIEISTNPIFQATKKQHKKAVDIKVKSLQCLAEHMLSANGRNYYMTGAYEVLSPKPLLLATQEDREWVSFAVPLRQVFAMIPIRYKAEEMIGYNHTTCFHFPDIQEFYVIIFRDGVIELLEDKYEANNQKRLEKNCIDASDTVAELTSETFRELFAADTVKGAWLYTQGKIKIKKGTVIDLTKFRGYFETQ